ncbi:hypothetical protein JCM11251_001397 [Rhodosporidiobolus azoricus]
MSFNTKKSVVLATSRTRTPFKLSGDALPFVPQVRYLGVERTANGVDFPALLDRKVAQLNGSLHALQAAGGDWPLGVRLALYRSFVRSQLDYGGPLLALALSVPSPLRKRKSYRLLDNHHTQAMGWVTGIPPRSATVISKAVAGLAPPLLRLEHLALGLGLSLQGGHPSNLAVSAFSTAKAGDPPPKRSPSTRQPLPALFSLLAWHPAFLAFEALQQQQLEDNSPPLSRATFIRRSTLSFIDSLPGLLPSYILPSSRPNGLVDGIFSISSREDCDRALRWRGNTFAYNLPCFVCGNVYRRSCLLRIWAYSGAHDKNGVVTDEQALSAVQKLVERTREERERSGKQVGRLDAMDVLLGNRRRDLAEIGYITLRVWERRMRALVA